MSEAANKHVWGWVTFSLVLTSITEVENIMILHFLALFHTPRSKIALLESRADVIMKYILTVAASYCSLRSWSWRATRGTVKHWKFYYKSKAKNISFSFPLHTISFHRQVFSVNLLIRWYKIFNLVCDISSPSSLQKMWSYWELEYGIWRFSILIF